MMQAEAKLASLAAAAGPIPCLDEVLRWLRQLETLAPADLGQEWREHGLLIVAGLRSPATLRQLGASLQQLSNVAKPLCSVASKLLLHLAAAAAAAAAATSQLWQ
jgi:hypothetical protein